MSAVWAADLAGLQRLIAQQQLDDSAERDERERVRNALAAAREADRQAVIDTLRGAERHMTSTEVSARAGVSRQRTDRILMKLLDQKIVRRQRRATRRADGEGFRNPYKYTLQK